MSSGSRARSPRPSTSRTPSPLSGSQRTSRTAPRGAFATFARHSASKLTVFVGRHSFAFVELKDVELAHQLQSLIEPLNVDGRELNISQANRPVNMVARTGDGQSRGRRADGPFEIRPPRFPPSSTIYVGNVAWSADEVTLEETFGQYGQILRIFQPKDRESGRAIGVAFVEFENVDEATAAVEAGQRRINIDGRTVQIDFASGRKDGPAGGRGGGPRGGDRFGGRQGGASRGGYGGQDRRAPYGGERDSFGGGERY